MTKNVKLNIARIILSILSIFQIAFIFSNSLTPASESSSSSGRVMTFLNGCLETLGLSPFLTQDIVRTLAHFTEFCLLGFLLAFAFVCFTPKKLSFIYMTLIGITVVPIVDEVLQLFAEGRTFQLSDICVDILGGLLGGLISVIIILIYRSVKTKNKSNS
ncbi:MAG: VanZ family protein [Ruminococcus sp.]